MSPRSQRIAVTLAAVVALSACSPQPATPSPGGSTATSAASSASSSASPETSASLTQALVYFVRDGRNGPRLVREMRDVSAATPARGALEAMISGPLDPDYVSSWPRGTRVLGISHRDHVITVDLSAEARQANVGAAFEVAMVQQLVWTVTEALEPGAAVRLQVEGAPAGDLWGHMDWSDPVPREDAMSIRQLVGIDVPAENAEVTSPVVVKGEAAVFEAHLPYVVLRSDGALVTESFTTTAEGQTFAPYTIELTLPAGSYIIEIREDDPSDGEGGPRDTDTRFFTVS